MASDAVPAQAENTRSASGVGTVPQSRSRRRRPVATVRAMAAKVVCISSRDGAGAHEAALSVANALGFRIIDEDIVTKAAVEAGVDEATVADVERRKSAVVRLIESLGTSGLGAGYVLAPPIPVQDQPGSETLRGLIRSVIEETAAAGSAVIVSHAASLALGERDDVLRVLVTASTPTREARLASALGVDAKEAARTLKRSDAGRADYIKRFYGIAEELPTHYDLVINTDKVDPDAAAQLIVSAAS
jgi:Cytidylate kinase-like family